VTIWFQNCRQNERKASLNAAIMAMEPTFPVVVRPALRKCKTRTSIQHTLLPSPYVHPPQTQPPQTSSLARRPTLETMARRSELRTAPPRTPTKRPDSTKSLWDNMPSSPLAPPSPPEQEFVQFGMGTQSLEWACAAARLVGKRSGSAAPPRRDDDGDDDDETDEEEVHEAITPKASMIRDGDSGDHVNRRKLVDNRVHACLYFIQPTGRA
jgi:hypothetical protein